MVKTKTPKQLEISIRSLKNKVAKLEAQKKRAVAAAKKKTVKKKAVKKKVVRKKAVKKKAVKKKKKVVRRKKRK